MKKIFLLCILSMVCITGCARKTNPIYLEDKYYENGKVNEIDGNTLKSLEDNGESFVIFVHLPYCSMLACFEPVLDEFVNENNIMFYSALSTEIENTLLYKEISHFPTVVIYEKGKIVAYLDAKSDSDLKYYQSIDDFTNWFSKYAYLEK